jgi:dihydroxyacetone kinase-like protein
MTDAGTTLALMLNAAAAAIEADKDRLSALDGVIGDADHGVTMSIGFRAVTAAIAGLPASADATDVLNTAAKSFLGAVGASAGPLYATAFMRAAAALKGRTALDGPAAAAMVAAMAEGVVQRGKAERGEKTMVDAWAPAAEAAAAATGDARAVLAAAADAAAAGADATKAMRATKGRAARLADRTLGHVDPGAASTAVILRAMADAL